MSVEHGDPVDPRAVRHVMRARWQHGHPHLWDVMYVAVGELGDGRRYVDITAPAKRGARAYATKQAAWIVARKSLGTREGDWVRLD